jgi:hypothetical protein
MNFASYTRRTMRRYLVPVVVFAVLFASVAEASHHHRDQLGQRGDTHLRCLLCLHSTGSAGVPPVPTVVHSTTVVRIARSPAPQVPAEIRSVASYDARGPPSV